MSVGSTPAAVVEQLFATGGTVALENTAALTAATRIDALNTGRIEFGGGNATLALDQLTLDGQTFAGDTAGLINPTANTTVRLNVANGIHFFGFNAGGAHLLLGGAGNLCLAGTMDGNGNVAKIGTGKVTLDGAFGDWSGGIVVRAGTLAGAQGLFNSRAVNILGGAQVEFLDGDTGPIELSELSGNVTMSATGLTLTQNTNTVFGGALSGSGPFVRAGSGTLMLSGNVSAGSLRHNDGTTTFTGEVTTGALTVAGGSAQFVGATVATGLNVSGGAATFTGTLPSNLPSIVAQGGSLTVPRASVSSGTSFTGNIDTGGFYWLSGTGTALTTNAGSITVRDQGNILYTEAGGLTNDLTSNTGTLRVLDGGNVSVASNFTNTGTVVISGTSVNGGSSFGVSSGVGEGGEGGESGAGGTFTQNAGSLTVATHNTLTVPSVVVNGGAVAFNGTLFGDTITLNGGRLTGNGLISGSDSNRLTLSGGTFSPGNSPGVFSAANATFNGGGRFEFELNALPGAGTPGTNWDLLSLSATLTINAIASSPFLIDLVSLTSANTAGLLAGFDFTQNYAWSFVTAATIAGFDSDAFLVDTSGFANPFNGTFSVALNGTSLDLIYTTGGSAIPEPSTYAAIFGALALGLAAFRRRK